MEISINNTHEATGLAKVCDFTIETNGIMVKALTSRLYSNPIESIVRELASNALDACSHTPMEISIPNYMDPNFTIRDHGMGISPEDMAGIFVRFGSSTKRRDNSQIGGFGLGAKSPFAIVNSFTINSYYAGTNYHYVASIQEDGMPALHLVSTSPTDQTGLRIQVPASGNHYQWQRALTQIQFFNPRPIILNFPFTYPNIIHDEADFSVLASGDPFILVGPVAYPFRPVSEIVDALGGTLPPVALKFPIGDLEVTASREEIVYSPATISKIKAKFIQANRQYRSIIQSLIDACPDVHAAWRLLIPFSYQDKFKYRGHDLHTWGISAPTTHITTATLTKRITRTKRWRIPHLGPLRSITNDGTAYFVDVDDRIQQRIEADPDFKRDEKVHLFKGDTVFLDSIGYKYTRLSSIPFTSRAMPRPRGLRSINNDGKLRVTTEIFDHYIILNEAKEYELNTASESIGYSLYRFLCRAAGVDGFYVLPSNIRKIPPHLKPLDPTVNIDAMLQHITPQIEYSHYAYSMTQDYDNLATIFAAMDWITPPKPTLTYNATEASNHDFLSKFGFIDRSKLTDWKATIDSLLSQHPEYAVFKSISLNSAQASSLATLLKD